MGDGPAECPGSRAGTHESLCPTSSLKRTSVDVSGERDVLERSRAQREVASVLVPGPSPLCCLRERAAIGWPVLPLLGTAMATVLLLQLDGGRSPQPSHLELGSPSAGFSQSTSPLGSAVPGSTPANLRTFHLTSREPELACGPSCLLKEWLRALPIRPPPQPSSPP